MRKGLLVVLSLLAVLVLLVGACGQRATPTPTRVAATAMPTPTPAPQFLMIGFSTMLSGGGGAWGRAVDNAGEMVIEEVNNAGGIKIGGKTYMFKYQEWDNEYTIEGDLEGAKKLINTYGAKYIIFCGNAHVGEDYAESQKVWNSPYYFSPVAIGRDKTYAFRICQTSEQYAAVLWKYVKDTYPSLTKVAITTPDYAVGYDLLYASLASMDWLGGYNVVYNKPYDPTTTDFAPLVTAMLATKPDIIDMGAAPPGDSPMIIKLARDMGFKGPMVTLTRIIWDLARQLAGTGTLEGVISAVPEWDDPKLPKECTEFYQRYLQKYGPPFVEIAGPSYDILRTLFAGMKVADSVDSTAIRDAMEKPGFAVPSLFGTSWFGAEDLYGIKRQAFSPQFITRFEGGKAIIKKMYTAEEALEMQRKIWAKYQQLETGKK